MGSAFVAEATELERSGLAAVLDESGLTVADVSEPFDHWAERDDALLLVLIDEPTVAWIGRVQRPRRWHCLVMLRELTAAAVAPLLAVGVGGFVEAHADAQSIRNSVAATLGGHSLLSITLSRELMGWRQPDPDRQIREDEAAWLERLADGASVATLADEVGFSERQMFRMLYGTYSRLGARTRSEAIAKAARAGWIA